MFCGSTCSASLPPAQGEMNVEKVSTRRTDHDRDHLDPNQPIRDVQGLCSTDQTQETRAISCRLNCFPSENDLSYRPGMSLPPKIYQGRYFSGDHSLSVRCVKASLAEGEKPPNVARAARYHHPLSIDRQIEQKRAASIPPA